jgi:hypothetical protein
MKKFHKKAFSLVELSVILLIISVVLLGVVKGNYLLSKSRLSNAQTLTQNSGILDIPDLVLWLETSLESSFVKSEAQDATNISTWYNNQNISPKNNASQSTLANQPKFYENAFNSAIPAVRFDGNNDFLNFDGSNLSNTNYTIFVVEQRRSNKSSNYFIGGTATSTNSNLFVGYSSNAAITFSQYGNSINYNNIPSYDTPISRIHVVSLSSVSGIGKRYWLNGILVASDIYQNQILSFAGAALGRYTANYFNGDIGEVIIFTRSLTTNERRSIENYLGKKYNIKVS